VGCVSSGMSYNGLDKNGQMQWDKCTNVYPIRIEFAQNIRDFSVWWNVGTANWLKNYVYLRIESKNPMVPLLATFIMSAFWHGFYPGYYGFFIAAGFLTEAARESRRRIRPYFLNSDDTPKSGKIIYDILGCIVAEWSLSYWGTSFLMLDWGYVSQLWKSMHYIGHVFLVVYFILVRFIPAPKRASTQTKKKI